MQPAEHCTKTGDRVMEVLRTKHPNKRPLSAASQDTYTGRPPELVPVDIMNNMVTEVAVHLSRGAGTGEGGLSEPRTLAPEIGGGERGSVTDGGKLCKMPY